MGRIAGSEGKIVPTDFSEDPKKTDSPAEIIIDGGSSPTKKQDDSLPQGEGEWGMDVIWDANIDNSCTPCNRSLQYYTCFGFFDGWTALERNFFLLLLVILCYQLHFFSFFHSADISIGVKYETPVLPLERESESFGDDVPKIDTKGVNWAPIYKRETQLCVNLDSIIKATDTVTTDERKLWGQLKCQEELKELYIRWFPPNIYLPFFPESALSRLSILTASQSLQH
jgi:hypothetical protein